MGTFELALAGVFVFLILLRLLAVVIVAFAVIRPARSCPACFLPTVPVRVPWRLLLPGSFEWRWCPDCGWQGPSRRGPSRPVWRPSRRRNAAPPAREDRRDAGLPSREDHESRSRERGLE